MARPSKALLWAGAAGLALAAAWAWPHFEQGALLIVALSMKPKAARK